MSTYIHDRTYNATIAALLRACDADEIRTIIGERLDCWPAAVRPQAKRAKLGRQPGKKAK